jgi:alpha-tubulin suppressor-like RCC1 family protein
VHINVPIRQIACGGLHTAAVTDAGKVYTWGDARSHQLGYAPHGFTNQPTPEMVPFKGTINIPFITQVACGQSHTIVLDDRGQLWSWGTSRYGQVSSITLANVSIIAFLALPCLALPCLALPCLALPCLALPCLALPCIALPCLASFLSSLPFLSLQGGPE